MAIKNIIFDFGDVFVNLDKTYLPEQLNKLSQDADIIESVHEINKKYEVGAITTNEFLSGLHNHLPTVSKNQLIDLWNGMLLDFPTYRLDFLQNLKENETYKLFLLSNTNELHISNIQGVMESSFDLFRKCFDAFYLSHEIGLRKPNLDIYEFVLKENGLKAHETLFIDDTLENVEAAKVCGIHGWHLQVGKEDVIELAEVIASISI
jgi:putative hydrolase of the HAD superfamily